MEKLPLPPLSDPPLISIVVPSYNQGRYIARTLESIISQTYRPLEVLVVDGASTDETLAVLETWAEQHNEIRWISEPDCGPADAVNKGLAMARGEILGIQSSDDMYYADALQTAVDAMRSNPQCGLIYGDSDAIDAQDRYLGHYRMPEFAWSALFGMSLCMPQQSVFFRKALADQHEGWRAEYFSCDLDYWLRLMLNTQVKKVPFTFSAYRVYPEQRTQGRNFARLSRDYRRMIHDNKQLKTAPRRMRRWARASVALMFIQFPDGAGRWRMRARACRAFVLFPSFPRYAPSQPLLKLIPGYKRIRKLLGSAKKKKPGVAGPVVTPGGPRPETAPCSQ